MTDEPEDEPTVVDLIHEAVLAVPDAVALEHRDGDGVLSLTYRELGRQSCEPPVAQAGKGLRVAESCADSA